jgi:hypothetical protein
MSARILLTLPDELAALLDARRGPLDRQTFIMATLATACEGQTLAERVAQLERQVAELRRAPTRSVIGSGTTDSMLSFD